MMLKKILIKNKRLKPDEEKKELAEYLKGTTWQNEFCVNFVSKTMHKTDGVEFLSALRQGYIAQAFRKQWGAHSPKQYSSPWI